MRTAMEQETGIMNAPPRPDVLVRLHFYDDDHGKLGSPEVSPPGIFHTLPVPVDADEVTVELIVPQGAVRTDADILFEAEQLMQRYPDADASDPMMAGIRARLHRIAVRALEAENQP